MDDGAAESIRGGKSRGRDLRRIDLTLLSNHSTGVANGTRPTRIHTPTHTPTHIPTHMPAHANGSLRISSAKHAEGDAVTDVREKREKLDRLRERVSRTASGAVGGTLDSTTLDSTTLDSTAAIAEAEAEARRRRVGALDATAAIATVEKVLEKVQETREKKKREAAASLSALEAAFEVRLMALLHVPGVAETLINQTRLRRSSNAIVHASGSSRSR
jgi:hypothetical protein